MGIQRNMRPPALIAAAVAMVAAILSLVLGFSGNLTAMLLLTLLAAVAAGAAAIMGFRSPPARNRRV